MRMLFSNLALLYFCRLFRYVDITEALTISPITWLSLRSVRFTPRMPNTTKTIAPVSTRGRTAGWPHAPPLHGLKPSVLDGLVLAADEGSVKIVSKKNLLTAFIYTVKFPKKCPSGFRQCHFTKLCLKEVSCGCLFSIFKPQ